MSSTKLTPQLALQLFKEQRDKLLPIPEYKKMVPATRQKKEIELLQETIGFERFFFVLNLHQMTIENVYGLNRWLGYTDNEFSLYRFLQIIHPAHFMAHNITATTLIEGLMRGDWKVEFMKHRYINEIALQHRQGHYLLFKRLGTVFQHTEKHQLLEYMNEFTLIGEYDERPFGVRALHEDGSKTYAADMFDRIKKTFENKNLFSFQELRILRKYAYISGIQNKDLAAMFKVKETTIATHKKRIRQKAEALFQQPFVSTLQVAQLLRKQGLI